METLAWERLLPHFGTGQPFVLAMGGSRGVRIGFDPVRQRLFIRIERPEALISLPPSPYVEIDIAGVQVDGKELIEISTVASHLRREFHHLARLLTEHYEDSTKAPSEALGAAIEHWRELVTQKAILSTEQQLGLMGEMAFLQAVIATHGVEGADAWTAYASDAPDRHDFRLGSHDIEVKSTLSAARAHFIHGLHQLQPHSDRQLFLLSIRFATGGFSRGASLLDRVTVIQRALAADSARRDKFAQQLKRAGYIDANSAFYTTKYIIADAPIIIRVDNQCPRLQAEMLHDVLGQSVGSRISDNVTYQINVDGLGNALVDYAPRIGLGHLRLE